MRCETCRGAFIPTYFLQKTCSKDCLKIFNTMKKEKKKPVKKVKLKKLSTLINEFEKVFNEWIRKRDNGKPCISCGEYNTLQAGHYFPVSGYKALRFNEDNVHGECAGCNCFSEGHLILYGVNLIDKIGQEDYNSLMNDAKLYKKGTFENEYYQNCKWNRDAILLGISKYKDLLNL